MKKLIIDKISISLFMLLFFFTLIITQAKPNLNKVDANHIDLAINGVGKKISNQIVQERKDNGDFKNKEDFYARVVKSDKYRIGDKTYEKIVKKYEISN